LGLLVSCSFKNAFFEAENCRVYPFETRMLYSGLERGAIIAHLTGEVPEALRKEIVQGCEEVKQAINLFAEKCEKVNLREIFLERCRDILD